MELEQKKELSPEILRQFSGSDSYHRHWLKPHFMMTAGINHTCENGLAWFTDIIFSAQKKVKVATEDFQVWHLRKIKSGGCVVEAEDGNGNRIYRQRIPFTDYPFDKFKAYAVQSDALLVAMLPGEY